MKEQSPLSSLEAARDSAVAAPLPAAPIPPPAAPENAQPPGLALLPPAPQPITYRYAPGFAVKLNVLMDITLILAAVILSTWLPGRFSSFRSTELWFFAAASTMVWLVVGTALCLYTSWLIERSALDYVALVTVQVMAVITVQAMIALALPTTAILPSIPWFLLLVWPVAVTLRLFLFRRLSEQEQPMEEVLIVGTATMGQLTGKDMEAKGRHRVAGYVRFKDETGASAPAAVLGTAAQIESILRTVPVDAVYIAGNVRKHADEMQAVVKQCERFGIPFALPAYHVRLDRARPAANHGVSDGFLHFVTYDAKPHQLALKRLFDIVVSAVALWALLPLFATVAIIIKITSRGPIFFKQVRVGLRGKPFHMIKFRSMVVNAEQLKEKLAAMNEQSGPVFKMKQDPRITRVGRFIRKYSIDELPQLINVLRGEMSVVGPRPPVPTEVAKYEAWQRRRLSVRPGLTCIWQVSGRNQIGFEQWMYLDMQYIDHWSLKKDIDLILKTVPVVITGSGAS